MLGHEYLHQHSIGYGPSLQLEDAALALEAFWTAAEKRVHSSAWVSVEQLVLTRASQRIECILLELAQNGWNRGLVSELEDDAGAGSPSLAAAGTETGHGLLQVMQEDPALVAERAALVSFRARWQQAADSIHRMEQRV